jgi:hypothetical protein
MKDTIAGVITGYNAFYAQSQYKPILTEKELQAVLKKASKHLGSLELSLLSVTQINRAYKYRATLTRWESESPTNSYFFVTTQDGCEVPSYELYNREQAR